MALDIGSGTTSGLSSQMANAFGRGAMGTNVLGGSYTTISEQFTAPVETDTTIRYVTQWAGGMLAERMFSSPRVITITYILPISEGGMLITFYTRQGAKIGAISSNALYNTVKEISWQIDDEGCGDAEFTLTRLPSFPIVSGAQVGFRFGRSTTENYRGILRIDPQQGTTKDEYVFRIAGLREQLSNIKVAATINGPADVGATVKYIYDTYVAGNTDVGYSPDALDTETGTLHQDNIEFDSKPVSEVLKTLASMVPAEAGVNEQGKLLFLPEDNTTIQKVFHVGWNLQDFDPEEEKEAVKNSISVLRDTQDGSGDSGWTVAYIANDLDSQGLYGVRELQVHVPGYWSATDSETVGESILSELKTPQFSAKCKIPIYTSDDILSRGLYRFISSFGLYTRTVTECEDTINWNAMGSGDLAISVNNSIYYSGNGSLEFSYTSAFGQRAEYTFATHIKKQIDAILFYVRAAKLGSYITFGWGNTSWAENQITVPINISNTFQLFEWDVSNIDTDLGVMAWQINDTGAGAVYLDRVIVRRSGNEHYDIRLKKVKYKFTATDNRCTAEFGPVPSTMEDYLKGIIELQQSLEAATEVK